MNLRIRRFEAEDLQSLYELLSDEEVMRYIEPPFTFEQTRAFLEKSGLTDNPLIYAVEDEGRIFIGYVIYHDYDVDSVEIGWVLLPGFWNNGFASELTEEMIKITKRNNKKVIIECDKEQITTISIARKLNFSFVKYVGNLCIFKLP